MSVTIGPATALPTVNTAARSTRPAIEPPSGGKADEDTAPSSLPASGEAARLDDDERRALRELEARDREVRAHEAAHLAAAGGLAMGGANFTMQRGPDGRMYAVGGEVAIDVAKGNTPQETIARAERIRAAALAPAEPSAKDMQVAARATRMAAEARAELAAAVRDSYGGRASAAPGSRIDEQA
ncbi:MAG: hypothetical protein H6945_11135 [Zoogloeaceae bacterium]|nr:hypothetical protein [Rhodocyclaceae bacterium]MCP5236279.1 hypothetical protein [Zoogloeaceae bacterium]